MPNNFFKSIKSPKSSRQVQYIGLKEHTWWVQRKRSRESSGKKLSRKKKKLLKRHWSQCKGKHHAKQTKQVNGVQDWERKNALYIETMSFKSSSNDQDGKIFKNVIQKYFLES